MQQAAHAMLEIQQGLLPSTVDVVEASHKLLLKHEGDQEYEKSIEVSYAGNKEVRINVSVDNTRLLVLNDLYAPGWRAEVDGEQSAIYPVNLIARGVIVPPGTHEIVMNYREPGVVGGALISALTLMLLFVRWYKARNVGYSV